MGFPSEIVESLNTIFGDENFMDDFPVLEKKIDDDFSAEAMAYPVMRGLDKFGDPKVIMKLKIVDRKDAAHLRSDLEIYPSDMKEKILDRTMSREFIFFFGVMFKDDTKLWKPGSLSDRGPKFFKSGSQLYNDQITYEDGSLHKGVTEEKIQEFQKLFKGEAAKDDLGILWRLAE